MGHDSRVEAAKLWPVLVDLAARGQTTTYGRSVTPQVPLDLIGRYCFERARPPLPPLTILVVNADTKRPGDGIVGATPERFAVDLERVFTFDWSGTRDPFAVFADS